MSGVLVSWCKNCLTYFKPYTGPRGICGSEGYGRTLRKRRVFICRDSICENGPCFFSQEDFWNHQRKMHRGE